MHKYVVKHHSGCVCEGALDEVSTGIGRPRVEQIALFKVGGLIQPGESLTGTKRLTPTNESERFRSDCLYARTSLFFCLQGRTEILASLESPAHWFVDCN